MKERRYGVACSSEVGSLFLTLSIIGARRVLSDILFPIEILTTVWSTGRVLHDWLAFILVGLLVKC